MSEAFYRVGEGHVVVQLRLTPKGGRDALDGVVALSDGRLVLQARVRAAPDKGAANAALEGVLAKALGVRPIKFASSMTFLLRACNCPNGVSQ